MMQGQMGATPGMPVGNEATQQVMEMGGAPLPGAVEGGMLY
jgi:hypothetical protein